MLGEVTEEAEGIWRASCPAAKAHGRKVIVTRERGSGRLRVVCHGGCDLVLLFRALQVDIKSPASFFEATDQQPSVERKTSPEGVAGFFEAAAALPPVKPPEGPGEQGARRRGKRAWERQCLRGRSIRAGLCW
jgi:hypothetical protein